jgi:hypothetical protein
MTAAGPDLSVLLGRLTALSERSEMVDERQEALLDWTGTFRSWLANRDILAETETADLRRLAAALARAGDAPRDLVSRQIGTILKVLATLEQWTIDQPPCWNHRPIYPARRA